MRILVLPLILLLIAGFCYGGDEYLRYDRAYIFYNNYSELEAGTVLRLDNIQDEFSASLRIEFENYNLDYNDEELSGKSKPGTYYGGYGGCILGTNLYRNMALFADIGLMTLSEFKDESNADVLKIEGEILITDRRSNHLLYGLGASYRDNLGDLQWLPSAVLHWRFSENHKLMLNLPYHAELLYDPLDGLEFALTSSITGNEYQGYRRLFFDGTIADYSLHYSIINIGVKTNVRLTGEVFMSLETGAIADRRLELNYPNDRLDRLPKFDMAKGGDFYFKIKISLRGN